MIQMMRAVEKIHLFIRNRRAQIAANLGSTGQLREGRHSNQAVTINSTAEIINIQILCWDNVTNRGNRLISAAMAAPNPRLTNISGNTQQSNVPSDKKSVKSVIPVVFISFMIIYVQFLGFTTVP